MELSAEQAAIVNSNAESIVVSAVAGSGKTTLLLSICQRSKNKNILFIVYNSQLRHETIGKLEKMKIDHRVNCHTYHSLMGEVCGHTVCCDDVMFENLLLNKMEIEEDQYDSIIVDEFQDICDNYYRFVRALLSKNNEARFICVGDPNQMIYNWGRSPSNVQYMTDTEKYFPDRKFQRFTMSTSYRSTSNICRFVNFVCPTSEMIPGNDRATNHRVQIILAKQKSHKVRHFINKFIAKEGAERVMILYDTRYNWCVRKLINTSVHKFHIRRPKEKFRPRNTQDKVIVNSFCQAKGLERPCVIVFGLSEQSTRFGLRANQMYVALTRSNGGRLIIIQPTNFELHPYFGPNLHVLEEHMGSDVLQVSRFQTQIQPWVWRKRVEERKGTRTIMEMANDYTSEMLTHISVTDCYEEEEEEDEEEERPDDCDDVLLETSVNFGGNVFESVTEITVKGIMLFLESKYGQRQDRDKRLEKGFKKQEDRDFPLWAQIKIRELKNKTKLTLTQSCELATLVLSYGDFHERLRQIKNYHWVQDDDITINLWQLEKKLQEKKTVTFCQDDIDILADGTSFVLVWDIEPKDVVRAALIGSIVTGMKGSFILELRTGRMKEVVANSTFRSLVFDLQQKHTANRDTMGTCGV
jgi:hypothetical protein